MKEESFSAATPAAHQELLWYWGEGAVKGTEAESATMDENHRQLRSPFHFSTRSEGSRTPPARPQQPAGVQVPGHAARLPQGHSAHCWSPHHPLSRLSAGNHKCSRGGSHLLGHFESFQRSRAHRSPFPACSDPGDLRGKRLHFSSCGVRWLLMNPPLTTLGSHLRAATRHCLL